jgi:uncharacterized iron-regulated membrane protein
MNTIRLKKEARLLALRWHNTIGWWGAAALLIWGLSAIAHPMMSWFGPQAVKFYPPTLSLNSEDAQGIWRAIDTNKLEQARVAKIVPSATTPLLQITHDNQSARRYFSLTDGAEISNHDQQHARWLASYYTGRNIEEISHVDFQTEFDSAYPWVNRLLPVYKIHYSGEDALTVYIHTETNALAGLTNNYKRSLQWIFQTLHTWRWLEITDNENLLTSDLARTLLIGLFMLSLLALAATGLALVLLLKNRKMPRASRYWHRLLGYALWLPLLGWSASGFYHLVQAAYISPVAGIQLPQPLQLDNVSPSSTSSWEENLKMSNVQGEYLNALALVRTAGDTIHYRLSLAPSKADQHPDRKARYQGRPTEKDAIYIHPDQGLNKDYQDEQQAAFLASSLSGISSEQIANIELVTRFGPGYDFRNKRLPVWQIDFKGNEERRVFVDPASGILVDQNRNIDRYESLSFSLLHKWNQLTPLTGRFKRDVIIVATLLLCLLSTAFGMLMLIRKSNRIGSSKNSDFFVRAPTVGALGEEETHGEPQCIGHT